MPKPAAPLNDAAAAAPPEREAPKKPQPAFPGDHAMQQVKGVGHRLGPEQLGTPSKITRGLKPKKSKPDAALPEGADPLELMKSMFLQKISTDLHSNGQPTLADRVRKEGAAAYGGRFAGKKPKKRKSGKKK